MKLAYWPVYVKRTSVSVLDCGIKIREMKVF